MKYIYITLLIFVSIKINASEFIEKNKVQGFYCKYGQVAIELRSLEQNLILYLAENETGAPKYLELLDHHCKGLIKNLSVRLTGKIYDLNFQTTLFAKFDSIYIPSKNPCGLRRLKCDDEGSYINKKYIYERIQTMIDGYLFFVDRNTRVQP